MAGIDDNVAVDWVPHSPSPRAFFSAMMGGEDIGSNHELPGANKSEELFLGQEQMLFGNTHGKQEGDQLMGLGNFSEQKSSSRGGLLERMAARAGFNAPRLDTENIRSGDLALNSSGTQSPYLTIPAGLSPTTLLESPVFLSNSLAQPSPTTGKFSFLPGGNGQSSETITEAPDRSKDKFFEDFDSSTFAFKPLGESGSSFFLGTTKITPPTFPHQSLPNVKSNQPRNVKPSRVNPHAGNNMSLQAGPIGGSADSHSLDEQRDEREQRGSPDSVCIGVGDAPPAEDGYNWRKYGQKQVKGSEYPRSYYKCTNPNCPVKKKVERSHEGHITEIIYKHAHNHPKPTPNRRSALGPSNPLDVQLDAPRQTGPQSGVDSDSLWASTQNGVANTDWKNDNIEVTSAVSGDATLTTRNGNPFESGDAVDASPILSEEDEDNRATHGTLGYGGEGDESESKRRKMEAYATEMSGATRALREPRVVVQTTSEVDILDDGYRWRKYGQKVVKGNPNPRSYYKCTSAGCPVRKHVERASHDLKAVITTYEGKHNHDVPAARNSSHANSGANNNATAQSGGTGHQNHAHRSQPPQVHNGMARFERPPAFCSFALPGRQQMGPTPGFSFGMNHQPGLANLTMAGLGPGQSKFPVMPGHHPYLAHQQLQQQHHHHHHQGNGMGFMLPKGEPKVEPMSEPGLNLSNTALYQQFMSRLPQM